MSTKYNSEEPADSSNQPIWGSLWTSNTFTPALDYSIDTIVIKAYRTGACISADIDIYEADGAHKPNITGGSLGTAQVLQASIPESTEEVTFTFDSPVALTNGQEYAVVVTAAAATFFWRYGVTIFQDGYRSNSSDGGSSWSGPSNIFTQWFQVWGTIAGDTDPVDTPSPTDEATGQQSGSVDLSWADPNDPDFDDYEVYFGPTGSMVLVETGHATKSFTISDDMILGQEYSWRIDGNDGEDVIQGSVWTFTIESFAPPSTHLTNKKRLVVASFDQVWYEDIS